MAFNSAIKNTFFLSVLVILSCGRQANNTEKNNESAFNEAGQIQSPALMTGAEQTEVYMPLLHDKKVGIVANQTSVIFKNSPEEELDYVHLVDSLKSSKVNILKVFSPEHGFRGMADAGEKVEDGIDKKTALPIVSLYGKNKKPSATQLGDLDLVIFDIQDVGVRFYTYIATLQLVMEACAEQDIPVLVLDRPNPNGHYVDGPSMEAENTGFLGLNPIPLVYGMTIGEYARMINEEGWLEGNIKADLTVIPLKNYSHQDAYVLPIRPSPNLPNSKSVNLYPSLGLFEGTNVNAGRGTEFQFQRFGAPFLSSDFFDFTYVPEANFGAKNPKHKGAMCYGKDLSRTDRLSAVRLHWIIEAYQQSKQKAKFFNTDNFTRHAGTAKLQRKIEDGWTEKAIKESWKKDLEAFKEIRAKYLIYD